MLTNEANLFMKLKPVELLLQLEDDEMKRGVYTLHKRRLVNYAWAHKLINRFEADNIITSQKVGRRREIELTDKGRRVIQSLNNILRILNEG